MTVRIWLICTLTVTIEKAGEKWLEEKKCVGRLDGFHLATDEEDAFCELP